jgi:hypothetical protein
MYLLKVILHTTHISWWLSNCVPGFSYQWTKRIEKVEERRKRCEEEGAVISKLVTPILSSNTSRKAAL